MENSIAGAARIIVIVILASVATAAGWFASSYFSTPKSPQHALVFPEPMPLPEFELTDQDGARFGREDFNGRWTLLFFGFTHCPDICPATLQVMSLASQRLADERQDIPRLVLVSVDPERDTPTIMKRYTGHFGDDVVGITGEIDELVKLTKALGIYFEREDAAPNEQSYNVAHSAHVLVLDDSGNYAAVFRPPHSIDAIAADLPLIMSSQ